MVDQVLPDSVDIVNEWLTSLDEITDVAGRRVSHKLGSGYPAIRVTDIGPISRGPEESLRRVQLECWANDYDTASSLARTIEARVATSRGQWPSGYCGGGSVESGPFSNPDPDSERYRHQLDVALWLYPSPA